MVNVRASSFPKTYFLWKLLVITVLDLYLSDNRILYIWQVLESIHKFIIELHALKCLFVRGSNKKYRRGGFFHKKERLFHLLWKLSALEGNLTMWFPFLHPPEKGLPLPFSLAKTRIYQDTQLKGQLTALLWKLPPACSLFSHTE